MRRDGHRTETRRYRTWTVFLFALSAMLLLLLVPGYTALRRSERVYREIRQIQENHERTGRLLERLATHAYRVSIVIREFLLDPSPDSSRVYQHQVVESRAEMETTVAALRKEILAKDHPVLDRLQEEIDQYWVAILPVFQLTPEKRTNHAAYFLRQVQRPRRESILAIAGEVGRLNAAAYQKQQERLNTSEQWFRRDLQRVTLWVFLAALLVAGAGIFRIAWLEYKSREQHELLRRSSDELRILSTQLRHVQEEERKTISRELHDEVGQKLTALRMELGALERLKLAGATEFSERIAETKQLAEQSLRLIRDIAAGLRPSMLDDLGLGAAIQRQARQFSRHTGIPVSVEIDGNLDFLPERHRTYVYRIVQEGLTNCARHAQAHRIDVKLKGAGQQVDLAIQDDGVGMAAGAPVPNGIGLIGIEERVRELGGSVSIHSQPGQGTRLEVSIGINGGTA